jgi:hypothetical protein
MRYSRDTCERQVCMIVSYVYRSRREETLRECGRAKSFVSTARLHKTLHHIPRSRTAFHSCPSTTIRARIVANFVLVQCTVKYLAPPCVPGRMMQWICVANVPDGRLRIGLVGSGLKMRWTGNRLKASISGIRGWLRWWSHGCM